MTFNILPSKQQQQIYSSFLNVVPDGKISTNLKIYMSQIIGFY